MLNTAPASIAPADLNRTPAQSAATPLATVALVLVLALFGATAAYGQHSHGLLTPGVTFPTDDSVLAESPQMIMMSFRVDVTLLKLALYSAEGDWINIGFSYDPERVADSFAYPLASELPASDYYIARWSVTNGERALLNGEFRFAFGDSALPPSEIIASQTSKAVETLPATGSYRVVPE